MPKTHRAYRRNWWISVFKQRGWMQDFENGTFGYTPPYVTPRERYILPFLNRGSDGGLLHVPLPPQAPLPAQQTRPSRHSERRAGEHGIPADIDILEWYASYQKRDMLRQEKQTKLKTGEGKRDYYRDLVIDLYHAAGHSVGESVDLAYSPRGEELIRYLADDKRHSLNRDQEITDEEELNSAM